MSCLDNLCRSRDLAVPFPCVATFDKYSRVVVAAPELEFVVGTGACARVDVVVDRMASAPVSQLVL